MPLRIRNEKSACARRRCASRSPLLLAVLMRHLGVHCVWRQIDVTGPCNRARVDIDASEEIHIEQRSKRARQIFAV